MAEGMRIFPYRFLPDPVREFFLDTGIDDIDAIAKTFGLSKEAVDALDTIQQEILFGYEPVDKVVNLLRERLGYDAKLAQEVALLFIEKRFLPVDAYLEAMAFRTFTHLGGNVTIINVKRVPMPNITVSSVRRTVDEYRLQTRREPLSTAETPTQKSAVNVVSSLSQKPTAQTQTPPPQPRPLQSQKPLQSAQPARSQQARPLRETVQALDRVMDTREPARKGEAESATLVSGALDPSHELAPPPPAIVEEKPQRLART
ncbi:hypothetical protein HYV72_02420, partial [Candidatus Uhrbacteria bacterium]|nr:hypothetical protein [Candidatus Uhrbacteria bacterium]